MKYDLTGQCPCCQAPLSSSQKDENKITCSYCGAEIILKLPLDIRIEKIAFERSIDSVLEYLIPCSFSLAFIFFLIWRFWLSSSKYAGSPFLSLKVVIPLYLLILLLLGIEWTISSKHKRRCAEECGYSLSRLENLSKTQPTKQRKAMLFLVRRNINQINKQIKL